MTILRPLREPNPRLQVLGGLISAGLLLLVLGLWNVQVRRGSHYGDREQAQSLRRIRLPAVRGDIMDRHGLVLANNRPSYDVVLYLERLGPVPKRQDVVQVAAASLRAVGRLLGVTVSVADAEVRRHYYTRRPLPLPVWRDLSAQQVAVFAERGGNLPGAELMVSPIRQYPAGTLAAHVLGYVGQPEEQPEDAEEFSFYQPDVVGKQGVERALDEVLRGQAGVETIRVNPAGHRVATVARRAARPGGRVMLTLDARIQQIVERALAATELPAGKTLCGAAVVLDPRTGEVLALASLPAFDPNVFRPGASVEPVRAVLTNPTSPLLNRAIGACYAPGSTFKPITYLAALETGAARPESTAVCTGGLQIGDRFFGCWHRSGHGRVNALTAMKQSCDVWFYQHGMAAGIDALAKTAAEFGLGRSAGLDCGKDRVGLVPTPQWKRQRSGEAWFEGDTAQLAIGQSFLLVTPLQMALVAATLANGGTVYRPYLVQRIYSADGAVVRETIPMVRSRLSARAEHIALVRQSMLAAVQDADGTAHRAFVRGLPIAGKTGTAEFDVYEGGTRRRINRAWFIGFAPYEQPQVAVAVLIEDAVSGGHTAAPVAGAIFAGIFNRPFTPVGGGGGD